MLERRHAPDLQTNLFADEEFVRMTGRLGELSVARAMLSVLLSLRT